MRFLCKGKFKMKENYVPFEREIEAKTENEAKHKILSLFGSEHGVKRRFIKIEYIGVLEGGKNGEGS